MSHTCYLLLFKERRSQKKKKKKGQEPDGSREGEGGDRMGETIAAGRLTYFHEVTD